MEQQSTQVLTDPEIQSVYGQLGLTSASDRSRFNQFAQQQPPVTFDIVISTTSEPF